MGIDIKIKDLKSTNIGKEVVLKGDIKTTNKVSNNGTKYISFSLNDGTGEIWDNIFKDKNKEMYEAIEFLDNGKRYRAVGTIREVREGNQGFNGINLLKVEEIETKKAVKKTTNEVNVRLKQLFKEIKHPGYKQLINDVFKKVDLKLLYSIPVSENHYVYEGGLADHIIRTSEIINSITSTYNGNLDFNKDLLFTSVILFRVGKTRTLSWANGKATLTEDGVLFEDSSITHDIVSECLINNDKLNKLEKNCLLHIIDASKYRPEYGALAEPKTKEAFLLYYAEMISLNEAKFSRLKEKNIDEDNNIIYAPNHKVYFLTENLSKEEE